MLSSAELSQLWQDHSAALLLLARGRCTAPEDCVQEAFIRLAVQDPAPDVPLAWLVRVVRNEAMTIARNQRRRRKRESVAGTQRWFTATDDADCDRLNEERLQAALKCLEIDVREIIVAHIWAGMTFRQIEETFEVSRATAHRRYEAGLRELKRLMSQDVNESVNGINVQPAFES